MTDRRPVPIAASRQGAAREGHTTIAFGDLLRQFRVAAVLTQEELAARSAVSVRSISDLERHLRIRPQRETLRMLADALGLNDDERQRFDAAARAPAVVPPRLVVRDVPPSNLPVSLTPLIGREADLAAIAALLGNPATRLITVTGVGGVGKTRFVLDAASAGLPLFPDGIVFVPLAAIRDPAVVLSAIAQTFGLTERGTRGLRESLVAYLDGKQMLLVLDNFEQVLGAAVHIAALLSACEGLTVLVTSRAALHLRGEREYRLRPLTLPDLQETDDVAQVRRSPAVELFMQRATAINRDLVLERANVHLIAQICTRLDGLPLALELAASRTRVLQPAELLARLESRFSMLTDGASDLPARQQTLRRAIDWSYDLLPDEEQRLFRWLSVFVDGCTLEAAEAVGSALSGQPINLFSGLSSLVDKSLLQAEARSGTTRFTMLETVREYGLERLAGVGELAATQRAHTAYFLAWATAVDPNAVGEAYARWLTQLEAEHDNLRAALAWALAEDEGEIGVRLGAALWRFWFTRGYIREGRMWLEALLARDSDHAVPIDVRAVAQRGLATLALRQGDGPAAVMYAAQSLAGCREINDVRGMAAASGVLGNVASERNAYDEAITHFTASLTLAREIGDQRAIAIATHNLGRVTRFLGDYERAEHYYQESEALDHVIGDVEGLAMVLGNRGHMARDGGDPSGARPLIESSLALYEQTGQKRGIGIALTQLAMIACDTGDLAAARTYARRGMTIRRQIDDRWGIAQSLVTFGDIARATNDHTRAWTCYCDGLALYHEIGIPLGVAECLERLACLMARPQTWSSAARYYGAASAVRARIHAPVLPVDRLALAHAIAETRAALGEDAWAAACDDGRTIDMSGIVQEVASLAAPPLM